MCEFEIMKPSKETSGHFLLKQQTKLTKTKQIEIDKMKAKTTKNNTNDLIKLYY